VSNTAVFSTRILAEFNFNTQDASGKAVVTSALFNFQPKSVQPFLPTFKVSLHLTSKIDLAHFLPKR